MTDILEFLKKEGVSSDLLDGVSEFRAAYPAAGEKQEGRVPFTDYTYYGPADLTGMTAERAGLLEDAVIREGKSRGRTRSDIPREECTELSAVWRFFR